MTERIYSLAGSIQERLQQLEIEFHQAYWDSQVEASPENDARRSELEMELRRVKGDETTLEQVEAALADPIHDPVLQRQFEILRLALTGDQMTEDERAEMVRLSTAVESEFANYRPTIRGRSWNDNEIEDLLRSSNDSEERCLVWRGSKEIGTRVADRVRELARVRNAAARNLGFADFYRMELELQEMPEDWLFEVMDDLEQRTVEPFREWKSVLDQGLKPRFGTQKLEAWHYADPFFQSLPPDGRVNLDENFGDMDAKELALRTFRIWDIDLTAVLDGSDLYPRDRKCQHAFCLAVDRLEDVRILANVVPGERWIEVMLHECGHAAYDICIDRQLPYLLRTPTHTFVTEAIALLSGRLVRDRDWLGRIAGLEGSEISALQVQLERANAAQSLLFSRWGLVMVHFERDLYSDPEADLDARWWELVERFQLVPTPDDPPPGAWASKIHIAVAPVYYHNYLLGDMLASQLLATIEREGGSIVGDPQAARTVLDRVFRPGALLRWDSLVEAATGRALDAVDFAAFLTAALRS